MSRRSGVGKPVKVIDDSDLVVNDGKYTVVGRGAIPVHGLSFGERKVASERATSVYVVTQEQLNSGEFYLVGGSSSPLIDQAELLKARGFVAGRQAVPIFVSTGEYLTVADYYIDATNGDDSSDGQSPDTAWKTISKVNGETLDPGNIVAFKRGEMWRELLTVSSSGTAGLPIAFGAYGSGDDPIISGADVMATWTSYAANTWQKTGVTTEPFRVYLDDIYLTEGADRDSLNDHEWVWASDVLYVRDETGDPDGSGVVIEATQRDPIDFAFPGKDYITLQNLHLKKSNGMGVRAWESNTCTLTDCTIEETHNQGFWIRDAGNGTPNLSISGCLFDTCGSSAQAAIYGMGINITISNTIVQNSPCKAIEFRDVLNKQSTNFLVEHCQFLSCGGTGQEQAGVSPNGAASTGTNAVAHSGIIRYNIFRNLEGRGVDGFFRNCQIYYNIFDNIDAGAASSGIALDINGPNNEIYNNVIWQPENIGILFGNSHLVPDVQSEARNNIIASDEVLNTVVAVVNDVGVNPTLSNNIYYPNGTGGSNYSWKGSVYDFTDWVTQSSESNSDEDNPDFTNPGSDDFTLQSVSPCRNVGVDVSLTRDFAGISVPQETNPTIGAYEYII